MNKHDFNDAVKSFNITAYREQFNPAEELRKGFVKRFSIPRIRKMSIYEYAQGIGRKEDNFCYELEWKLGSLGRIAGTSATKFGIYFSRKHNAFHINKIWQRETTDESIKVLRNELADLIEAGAEGNLNLIRIAPFSPIFKGKILSTYFPEKYISIFSEEHLDYFIHRLDLDSHVTHDSDVFHKRSILINFKNSDPITKKWPLHAFSHFLYTVYPKAPKENQVIPSFIENIEFFTGDFTSIDNITTLPKTGKGDYEAHTQKREELGERGEYVALQYEIGKLKSLRIKKTPDQVSLKDDSLGYDIISFDENRSKIYIEVKATNCTPRDFRFFISSNELKVARSLGKAYHIYVVFNPNSAHPQIFDIGNPFIEDDKVKLIPVTYKLHLQKI